MTIKEYLETANKICEEFEHEKAAGCFNCPLKPYNCGVPTDNKDIEQVIDLVKDYRKTCPHCGEEI